MIAPNGRPAVIRTFGNPLDYVDNKRGWEDHILEPAPLRAPLPYAYGPTHVTLIRAHRLVLAVMLEALTKCQEAKVDPAHMAYGGIYCWRAIRGAASLSMHTWGIAVDLDPVRNPLGRVWRDDGTMLPVKVVEIFEGLGFQWGGRWARPDAQHFQFASGC